MTGGNRVSDLVWFQEDANRIPYLFKLTPWNIYAGEIEENHKLGIEDHKLEDTESLLHWVDVYVEVHDVSSANLSTVEMHSVIRLETKLRMPLPWLLIAQSTTLLDTNPGLDLKSIQSRPGGKVWTEKVREGRKEVW